MSHPEQLGFFAALADANREVIAGSRLIEIGSYAVNGTMRSYFATTAEYVGMDLVDGPGVDVLTFGHEVDHESGSYDIATSGECFEHDPHWRETFANMVRLTRPGGLVAFTCASAGRPEHGTRRTLVIDSPGTQFEGLDYYRNLTEDDFADLDMAGDFSTYKFWHNTSTMDLYFAGVRAGDPEGKPSAKLPERGRDLPAVWPDVAAAPRAAPPTARSPSASCPTKSATRTSILPYWQGTLKVQRRLGGRGSRAE